MLTAGEDDRRSPGTCHAHAANPQRSPVLVSPDASLSDRGVSTDEFDSKSPAAYSPRSYRGNYPIWRGVVVPQARRGQIDGRRAASITGKAVSSRAGRGASAAMTSNSTRTPPGCSLSTTLEQPAPSEARKSVGLRFRSIGRVNWMGYRLGTGVSTGRLAVSPEPGGIRRMPLPGPGAKYRRAHSRS